MFRPTTGSSPIPTPPTTCWRRDWLNDKILLIGTADGRWATVTLDLQRLIQLTLDSLRSPYSDLECTLHGIEPCPSTLDKAQRRYAHLGG
jgi:hypothetical protein